MSVMVDVLSWILLVSGGFFCLVGGIGLLRLPDFFCRVHGAGVIDSLGVILLLSGLMLQAGLTLTTLKLALVLLFLSITGPTAMHALARAAALGGYDPVTGDSENNKR